MRYALALLLLMPAPAFAWEVTLGPVCILHTETATAEVKLTFDPAAPLYSITVTRKGAAWPKVPAFGIEFTGGEEVSIGTTRHSLSDNGRALTVTDRGFGNVLNGLQFNRTATVTAGAVTETVPLAGAAEPVQAFRDCPPFTGA